MLVASACGSAPSASGGTLQSTIPRRAYPTSSLCFVPRLTGTQVLEGVWVCDLGAGCAVLTLAGRRVTCRRIGRMCLGIILMVRSRSLYGEDAYSAFSRHHWHVRRGSTSVLPTSHRVPGAQCAHLPPKVRRTPQANPLAILTRSTSYRLRLAISWDRSPPTNPRLKFPRPLLQRNPARARHLLRQQTVVLEHPPSRARAGHHHRRRWRRRKSERAPRHRRPDAA